MSVIDLVLYDFFIGTKTAFRSGRVKRDWTRPPLNTPPPPPPTLPLPTDHCCFLFSLFFSCGFSVSTHPGALWKLHCHMLLTAVATRGTDWSSADINDWLSLIPLKGQSLISVSNWCLIVTTCFLFFSVCVFIIPLVEGQRWEFPLTSWKAVN